MYGLAIRFEVHFYIKLVARPCFSRVLFSDLHYSPLTFSFLNQRDLGDIIQNQTFFVVYSVYKYLCKLHNT